MQKPKRKSVLRQKEDFQMFRSIIYTAIFALLLVVPNASGQVLPNWIKLESADGKFEATFPGPPKREVTNFNTPSGPTQFVKYIGNFQEGAFMVTYVDMGKEIADPWGQLMKSQDAAAKAVNGKVLKSGTSTLDGFPVRYYEVSSDSGDGYMVRSFAYAIVAGKRFYQVVVVREDVRSGASENRDFIGSFRLNLAGPVAKR